MLLLSQLFTHLIHQGTLVIVDARGRRRVFGGRHPGPRCALRLHTEGLAGRLLVNPQMALPEGYMQGILTLEEGTLDDLLEIIMVNRKHLNTFLSVRILSAFLGMLQPFIQNNSLARARQNVAHHYDTSNDIYRLFLDRDMQYSCGYFAHDDVTLEEAQKAKKEVILRKLALRDGMKVLEIGCGWGGLAMTLAQRYDLHVTGVTLSTEQYDLACQRVNEAGLGSRINLQLMDYRALKGRFDRIVSVGMFEHVGRPHYREFFKKSFELLDDHGVMLLHAIGSKRPLRIAHPWVEKYIFPGGYIPALSEFLPAVERAGFWVTDLEIWRRHYALTLRAWKERFRACREAVITMRDETFFRMWEMYLAGSEAQFLHGGLMVFHLQLTKAVGTLPLTRDYMNSASVPSRKAS